MTDPTSHDIVPEGAFDENPETSNDEGNPSEEAIGGAEPDEEAEGEMSEDDSVDEAPAEELSDVEPLVVERPRTSTRFADNPDSSYQYSIPIRYGISGNATRGSKIHPDAKHLTVRLPDAIANFFPAGVWVATRGNEVYFDFFSRNDQRDRTGHSPGDPWRLIKIKDSKEVAMAISRPYTKSRTYGELVRDRVVGAFKLVVPLALGDDTPEGGTESQPPCPMSD